jgi:hypothetical protein
MVGLTNAKPQMVCLAVVLALLFQVVLPLAHQPPRGSSSALAGIPHWIIATLCRVAEQSDASSPADDSLPSPTCQICPVCLAAQLASTLHPQPQSARLALPTASPSDPYWDRDHAATTALADKRPQSRGPPSIN